MAKKLRIDTVSTIVGRDLLTVVNTEAKIFYEGLYELRGFNPSLEDKFLGVQLSGLQPKGFIVIQIGSQRRKITLEPKEGFDEQIRIPPLKKIEIFYNQIQQK